ncbi:hypothetical protein QMG61_00990 [Cryobacterium sp. PH31-AA6]|uniref:hypothetical protein n=1 Tax=Cryobacterium sp. PH31-AA6 TaxID=3046205 RepID=UPI0024BAC1BD|nr:hypothetical protein [Cryobacterium sp. PH31-AA6]MDJ0322340.1 hypothetical protein [Cryobacterium sp. PH31-AA6]
MLGRDTAPGGVSTGSTTGGSTTGRSTTGRSTTGRSTTGRSSTGRSTTGGEQLRYYEDMFAAGEASCIDNYCAFGNPPGRS